VPAPKTGAAPAQEKPVSREVDTVDVVDEPEPPRRPATPQVWPRFETEPYQPKGGATPVGVLILMGMTFPTAVLCGFLLSFVGQWFYLVLLFPGGAALGVVGLGFLGVQMGKVNSPFLAGLIGVLAGTILMVSMHFFNYQRWGLQAAGVGFFQFIDIRAHLGIVLAGKGGGQGLNLGYIGTYIYFAVEFLFVVGICAGALFNFARVPFCTECHTWKKERTLGGFALPTEGTVKKTWNAAAAAFKEGRVSGLVDEGTEAEAEHVAFVLTAFECLNCAEEVPADVALKCVTKDKEGKTTLLELAKVTYPSEAVPVLESLCLGDDDKAEEEPEAPLPPSGA
jgi:hypothetical protein